MHVRHPAKKFPRNFENWEFSQMLHYMVIWDCFKINWPALKLLDGFKTGQVANLSLS